MTDLCLECSTRLLFTGKILKKVCKYCFEAAFYKACLRMEDTDLDDPLETKK